MPSIEAVEYFEKLTKVLNEDLKHGEINLDKTNELLNKLNTHLMNGNLDEYVSSKDFDNKAYGLRVIAIIDKYEGTKSNISEFVPDISTEAITTTTKPEAELEPILRAEISEEMLAIAEKYAQQSFTFNIKRVAYSHIVVDVIFTKLGVPAMEHLQLQYTDKPYVFEGLSPLVSRTITYDLTTAFNEPQNRKYAQKYMIYWKSNYKKV